MDLFICYGCSRVTAVRAILPGSAWLFLPPARAVFIADVAATSYPPRSSDNDLYILRFCLFRSLLFSSSLLSFSVRERSLYCRVLVRWTLPVCYTGDISATGCGC